MSTINSTAGGFFARLDPDGSISALLLRLSVAGAIFANGNTKLFGWVTGGGVEQSAAHFADIGLQPAVALTILFGSIEFFGGILIALGLFARPALMVVAAYFLFTLIFFFPNGYFWLTGGPAYNAGRWTIVWGIAVFAALIRGPGRYSLDAKLFGK